MVAIPAGGEFSAGAPPVLPANTAIQPAVWDLPPRLDESPEPYGDIARLMTQAGTLTEPGDDFFVEAPPAIGRVRSAFTTMRKSEDPSSPSLRAFLASLGFVVGFATIVLPLIGLLGKPRSAEEVLGYASAAVIVGGVCLLLVRWWTRFGGLCTYVGDNGIAVFQCDGDRDRLVRSDIFLFHTADELRIAQTRQYTNGIYARTDYAFTWSDGRGRLVYQISGRYKSEVGRPEPRDAYYFALAAESAWSRFLARDLERMASANGLIFFGLQGGDFVQLGPGRLILAQASKKIELRSDQIEKMTIGDGVISIWETGAKSGWFVNKGIHQFLYADLGNAKFFLLALDKLLGIRF